MVAPGRRQGNLRNMRNWKAAFIGAALWAIAPSANAAQNSDTYEFRVTIQTSCAIAVSDLDFGNVGVISIHNATAAVTIACSQGTPYTLSFDSASVQTTLAGVLTNGVNTLNYSAILTSAGGTGPGTATIIGTLPPQPTPPAGLYTDSRTVYLSY